MNQRGQTEQERAQQIRRLVRGVRARCGARGPYSPDDYTRACEAYERALVVAAEMAQSKLDLMEERDELATALVECNKALGAWESWWANSWDCSATPGHEGAPGEQSLAARTSIVKALAAHPDAVVSRPR